MTRRGSARATVIVACGLMMTAAFATPSGAAPAQGYAGRIIAKATGLPVPNAGSYTCVDSTCLDSTPADANGRYQNATDAGTYKPVWAFCCFDDNNPDFLVPVTHGANGTSLPGFSNFGGVDVTVNSGELTKGINFKLPEGGGISVHVHDRKGNPIAGIDFDPLWMRDDHQSGFASQTDASGDGEVDGVMAGKTRIDFYDLNGVWRSRSIERVMITVGVVTHLDVTLQRYTPTSVPGHVPAHVVYAPEARG